MEQFWEELDSGEVHIRDKWQFELKSEFQPKSGLKSSVSTQEFYLFIPNALQITESTYHKNQFYQDQTNLIRYKTPEFTFDELLNRRNLRSPMTRLLLLCHGPDSPENRTDMSEELKLLANVVRSTLRKRVRELVDALHEGAPAEKLHHLIEQLCRDLEHLHTAYAEAETSFLANWKDEIFYKQFSYIREFIESSVEHYLTGLLENIRLGARADLADCDRMLCDELLTQKYHHNPLQIHQPQIDRAGNLGNEDILYRSGMLNKFVLDVLLLNINRFSVDQQFQNWIGAMSAGIAMLIYFSLFIWLGNVFIINSGPFIAFTVMIYILKDRIKEGIKNLSYQHAFKWFSDLKTVIRSPDQKRDLGVIKESFSFLDPKQISPEIRQSRNAEFHTILETYQRPESVLYYKRSVEIKAPTVHDARRLSFNIIFRFNIHRFLLKASNAVETHVLLDPATRRLLNVRLPKVYHLNLIIRNTTIQPNSPPIVEFKKLRIIIDKNGIKRIEQLFRH